MRYLVTGATAFAGCHLTKLLLDEGHEVYCTSRRTNGSEADTLDLLTVKEFEKIKWLFCDLLDRESCLNLFRGQNFDGVFHLAAQSHPPTSFAEPFYTQKVNVAGTLNLLEGLYGGMGSMVPKPRFMFCSTSEVYGAPDLDDGQKISEDWPIKTVNPYASSKAAMDIFIQERINNGFLNGFITRAFSHTGPRRGKIFSISSDAYQIAKMLEGAQGPVIRVGNLDSQRCVMDVRDCVKAYYLLMMLEANGVFNVGSEECHPMRYYLELMLAAHGLDPEIVIDDALWRPIDIPVQIPDTSKLRAVVPWEPKIPIIATLRDLVEYWRAKF